MRSLRDWIAGAPPAALAAALAAVAIASIGKALDVGLAPAIALAFAYPLVLAALGFTSPEERRRLGRLVARRRLPAG